MTKKFAIYVVVTAVALQGACLIGGVNPGLLGSFVYGVVMGLLYSFGNYE